MVTKQQISQQVEEYNKKALADMEYLIDDRLFKAATRHEPYAIVSCFDGHDFIIEEALKKYRQAGYYVKCTGGCFCDYRIYFDKPLSFFDKLKKLGHKVV